ncbi:hypothetical protein ACFSKL_06825 [Belliella marina]|uniref:Uncharacterized protein n=1 Tax=Belliella marina TaxID=1644146 RepID=A0ABW4VM02_9BACT
MISWEDIKLKIHSAVRKPLTSGDPNFTEDEIAKGILLFRKIILYKSGEPELDGLSKIMVPALQDSLLDKKGELPSLRLLADCLEPFYKKILLICKSHSFRDLDKLTLIPVLKRIDINTALSTQQNKDDYPQLKESNLDSFKHESEYLYEICNTYLVRNKVHNSPEFSDLETLTYVKDLLVVYIYTVLKYSKQIDILVDSSHDLDSSKKVLNGGENKILFDFISFGNSTTEIKTQIIESYILHKLLDSGKLPQKTIKEGLEEYLDYSLTSDFFRRSIEKLRTKKKIEYNKDTEELNLSSGEQKRLVKVQSLFNDNKELFLLYYSDIIELYGVKEHSDKILEKLKDFFVVNYNIDIKEICDEDSYDNEDSILEGFLLFIRTLLNEKDSINLVKDLLKLCEESDFILRLSASTVIGNLTNPVHFENYIRKQKRLVYLDTQLILHALCTGYLSNCEYDNVYFRIVDELLKFQKSNPNIEFRFSRYYLSEVAYQLRMALLLIPFEGTTKHKLSTNVFYEFYEYLHSNDLLEADHQSFSDFLENWLLITEDDALEADCEKIISSNISSLLLDELNISVSTLPFYEDKETAVTVLDGIIKDRRYKLSSKSHYTMSNDALMVCHLANKEIHQDEPFFLTWDKSFTPFRSAFKQKFKRQELISWHLFNPSKFINHMSLLEFKIDPKSITNEYLPILDSLGLHEKVKTIFDSMNRLTDIKDISKKQRRRYVQLTQQVFNEQEFGYEVDQPEMIDNVIKPFETILDNINKYYHSHSKHSIEKYKKMMLKEEYFKKLLEIIISEISNGPEISNDLTSNIDKLLNDFLAE